MDMQNVLEYLKKQSRPVALGDITKALGMEHAEAARHLQALSRDNQAFRSVKGGYAYYSANPIDGEGAIPTQAFIGSIQKAVQATLGGVGMNAQTVQGNSATDVLLSLVNNATAQDVDLPAESPVNWTFNGGLKFENELFSVPIPDGFIIIACEGRAFAAVPEDSGIADGADELDLSQAEVQILDSNILGGAIEDPVLADPEIYHALTGNMGYHSAELMRNLEKGPVAALTNDVRLKLDGLCAVLSVQTGTGYSHMAWQMTCDGMKSLRVQTQHTPRAEVEREMNALVKWIAGLQWKHVMKRYPLNYSKLTQNSSTWLEAVQKKVNQLATYRQMSVSNEVERREGEFANTEEFRIAMQGVADEMAPVFARIFEEIAKAIPKVNGLDTKKTRELVDQIRGFYPIRIDSDATETVMIEASAEIKKNFSEMDSALKEIEEKEKATREAEKLARAEERARKKAEEQAAWEKRYEEKRRREAEDREKQRQAAEADAKRRAALEEADRVQFDTYISKLNRVEADCKNEAQELSQRLERRRLELSQLGLFKFSAKKQARADIERMTSEQNALPDRQKEKLEGVWKELNAESILNVLSHLALSFIHMRGNCRSDDIQKYVESRLNNATIPSSQITNVISRLVERGQIVNTVENNISIYRAVREGETAESLRRDIEEDAEKARKKLEDERKKEEKNRSTQSKSVPQNTSSYQDKNEAMKQEILNYLFDGKHVTVSEIIRGVPSLKNETTVKVSSLMRLLKLEDKVDKEVVKGKTLFFLSDLGNTYSPASTTRSYSTYSHPTSSCSAPRNTSSYQDKNEAMKQEILIYLLDGKHATVTDIIRDVPSLRNETVQMVSHLLRLLKIEGKVDKEVIRGMTYYFML